MSRKTTEEILNKKKNQEKIVMLTAYDFPLAQLIDQAGVDIILVGDSLANVILGLESTQDVGMDEMIHHCKAVARGSQFAHLVGDMPFMSYQADVAEGVRNAGRFLKEGGMDAVKLEGGRDILPVVRAIINAGIPVMVLPQKLVKGKVVVRVARNRLRVLFQ